MTIAKMRSMVKAIDVIEAQEMLKQFKIADWPNMKSSARQALHRQLYQKAYPNSFQRDESGTVTPEQFARLING